MYSASGFLRQKMRHLPGYGLLVVRATDTGNTAFAQTHNAQNGVLAIYCTKIITLRIRQIGHSIFYLYRLPIKNGKNG
jgi:hypothetical protein